ncbi:UL41 tegument host shutoff protein [Leporid alphaherpesvirus 4]|uniref:Virion host shutoff protein n=1 Tax=Leporid alphaherpesvirus 4 TaxID=481315 RepID=J9R077_9ALPH|nr:UL41 tegument host shutoff protein [Leporid alphaherpesvirus 4]AFR32482.1 UL41 tegument host shutoff protein [Leporid alphaherpesvirus 4]
MGLFGMLKFAHVHNLVKKRLLVAPLGCMTPIAVDLWNVMYTLVMKYQRRYPTHYKELVTVRCLVSLLRVFSHMSLYPIFVTDRGADCNSRVMFGAKAILARTTAQCKTDADAHEMSESPPPSPISADSESSAPRRWMRSPGGARRDSMPHGAPHKPALALSHYMCVRLLRALGYAYTDSGCMEADDACANLYHTNTVAYVHTTDTDLLLMGCDIVFDVNICYLPTIRCQDILQYFKMSYPQFLALFSRCHTDLHPNGTHVGVEDVLRECGWVEPGPSPGGKPGRRARAASQRVERPRDTTSLRRGTRLSWGTFLAPPAQDAVAAAGEVPGEGPFAAASEGWELAASRKARRHSEVPRHGDMSAGQIMEKDHREYVLWRRRHRLGGECDTFVWQEGSPTTIGELVDKRYAKHVTSLIAPRRRGRWSLLKRLPIHQDFRDEDLVRSLIDQHISPRDGASMLADQLCSFIPPPGEYKTILADFWDGA